jgi:Anti-sigma factor NepR
MKERKPIPIGTPAPDDELQEPTELKEPKRRKGGASLGPDIQAKIGKQLRAYYGGLIEPPPERFIELLRELDKPDDKGSSE